MHVLIEPASLMHARIGGLHHSYANKQAMAGLAERRVPEGSAFVFDVLNVETTKDVCRGSYCLYDESGTIIEYFSATCGPAMLLRLASKISDGRTMDDALRRIPETANTSHQGTGFRAQ